MTLNLDDHFKAAVESWKTSPEARQLLRLRAECLGGVAVSGPMEPGAGGRPNLREATGHGVGAGHGREPERQQRKRHVSIGARGPRRGRKKAVQTAAQAARAAEAKGPLANGRPRAAPKRYPHLRAGSRYIFRARAQALYLPRPKGVMLNQPPKAGGDVREVSAFFGRRLDSLRS